MVTIPIYFVAKKRVKFRVNCRASERGKHDGCEFPILIHTKMKFVFLGEQQHDKNVTALLERGQGEWWIG
jgi:hypothetical protein